MGRVEHLNRSEDFLGKVVAVVLFGSMLKPEVDRLSDVDVAVEIGMKEPDRAKAGALNEQRVQEFESDGYRFRGFLERQFFWHYQVLHCLKGRSLAINPTSGYLFAVNQDFDHVVIFRIDAKIGKVGALPPYAEASRDALCDF